MIGGAGRCSPLIGQRGDGLLNGDEPNGGTAENCVFLTVALDGYPGWSDWDCSLRNSETMVNHALCEI